MPRHLRRGQSPDQAERTAPHDSPSRRGWQTRCRAHTGYFVLVRNFEKSITGKPKYLGEAVSNADGIATAQQEPGRPFIYARQLEKGLVGIGHVRDKKPDGTLAITMYPECAVSLHLTSTQLGKAGHSIERPMADVGLAEAGKPFLVGFFYARTDFTVLAALPPGTYQFWCMGTNTCGVPKEVTIKPGLRKLDAGTVDLPADRFILLEGKPAPNSTTSSRGKTPHRSNWPTSAAKWSCSNSGVGGAAPAWPAAFPK